MNITDYLSKQLQEREELVAVVRRHPATLVPGVGFGGILVLLDFFLVAWWFKHDPWGIYGFATMAFIGLLLISRSLYIWSNNVLAITTHRVIDIDQRGFFERNVAEATYEKIQDVRYSIRGLWSTIFRFGTVIVQTAGTTTNLELASVRHPADVQQLITETQRRRQPEPPDADTTSALVEAVNRLQKPRTSDGLNHLDLRRRQDG